MEMLGRKVVLVRKRTVVRVRDVHVWVRGVVNVEERSGFRERGVVKAEGSAMARQGCEYCCFVLLLSVRLWRSMRFLEGEHVYK